MTDNTDILIREYDAKLAYYRQRIEEVEEQKRIIKGIVTGKLVSLSGGKEVV